MRRKDREMPAEFGLSVIDRTDFGTLTIIDPACADTPYAIPLSLVRIENKLYFHSAKDGYKYHLFQTQPKVKIVFVANVKVPDLFDEQELSKIQANNEMAKCLSQIFTTEFASAIVTGQVKQIFPKENNNINADKDYANTDNSSASEHFNNSEHSNVFEQVDPDNDVGDVGNTNINYVGEIDEYSIAMKAICQKYVPDKMFLFESALKFGLSRTAVFAIEIENITAKRKKFDTKGTEMKWQRME